MGWLIPLPIRERGDDESRAQGEEMQKLSHLGWGEREGGGGGVEEDSYDTLCSWDREGENPEGVTRVG